MIFPEQEKRCACGCTKQRIGEEVTEQLEIIPAQLKVITHVRSKYACNRCDEQVSIAPMPQLFLPKSMATPSLVAHTLVSKYQDHLPLYRQEKIWQRMGIEIARNTLCGWIMAAAEVCMPMRDTLMSLLLASGYVQADVGRKNWLFSGSPRGAHASALFYSLIATAIANGWNPFNYLQCLFKNIRACKTQTDYVSLLPFNISSKNC
jgi:transposase